MAQNERRTVRWAADQEMAMEACVLRNDVADRWVRSGDHNGQNQSDGAYAAARYLVALS
jgi:hypothetical protein